MNEKQIKGIIIRVHRLYYTDDVLSNKSRFLEFHKQLQELFNFAGIKETLCDNNPGEMTPDQVRYAIKQGWIK